MGDLVTAFFSRGQSQDGPGDLPVQMPLIETSKSRADPSRLGSRRGYASEEFWSSAIFLVPTPLSSPRALHPTVLPSLPRDGPFLTDGQKWAWVLDSERSSLKHHSHLLVALCSCEKQTCSKSFSFLEKNLCLTGSLWQQQRGQQMVKLLVPEMHHSLQNLSQPCDSSEKHALFKN